MHIVSFCLYQDLLCHPAKFNAVFNLLMIFEFDGTRNL